MKKNNQKHNLFLLILYLIVGVISCVGTSLAFFTVIKNNFTTNPTSVESAVLPSIIFENNSALEINADLSNFNKNSGNIEKETTILATLKNGNVNEYTEYNYKISLNILNNDFIYSTTLEKPEIILNIIDPNNTEITSIDGLEYKENGNVKGFDITDKIGKYNIVSNYKIKTSSTIKHKWLVKVTLVNYDENQNPNTKKNFSGCLKIGLENGD